MTVWLLIRLWFSFIVSNWIYSEATLAFPPLDRWVNKAYQATKIPTHDQWTFLESPLDFHNEDSAHDEGFVPSIFSSNDDSFFDTRMKSLWPGLRWRASWFSDSSAIQDQSEYLSGEDIFVQRPRVRIVRISRYGEVRDKS